MILVDGPFFVVGVSLTVRGNEAESCYFVEVVGSLDPNRNRTVSYAEDSVVFVSQSNKLISA
jgi:hypothetical protein